MDSSLLSSLQSPSEDKEGEEEKATAKKWILSNNHLLVLELASSTFRKATKTGKKLAILAFQPEDEGKAKQVKKFCFSIYLDIVRIIEK